MPISHTNPQAYDTSRLSGSQIELDYYANPDALFNSKTPNLVINHEKPEHRLIIMLKAQGKSNKEIAQLMGKTDAWISQVLRQPWARQRLVNELKEAGRDAIQDILAGAAADSVFTLIEQRDSAPRPADRIAAANSLLDRFLGKPTQRVETDNVHRNLSGDVEALDRELNALEQEEKRLAGRN